MPDLQHLRTRAPLRIADADALRQHRNRRYHSKLEGSIDRERPTHLPGDEGLDPALVSTQIGESNIEHDRKEQGSYDRKYDCDEAAP